MKLLVTEVDGVPEIAEQTIRQSTGFHEANLTPTFGYQNNRKYQPLMVIV